MQLSAFADGELPDNEKELLLRRLSQDGEMRRQVAEYLAIGRAMRGEAPVPGIDNLRDRIASAIGNLDLPGEDSLPGESSTAVEPGRRLLKPLAGLATAAAVALLAIFGMQRMAELPEGSTAEPVAVDDASFSTEPVPDKLLDQYRLMHQVEAADSSIRTRFTSIETRQNLVEEADPAPDDATDAAGDEEDETPEAADRKAPAE